MSNGEVKVTYPDGKIDYMLNRDANILYKKLYAAKIVDKLVLESLKECGLTLENAHLSDYIKFTRGIYSFSEYYKVLNEREKISK